MTAAWIRLWTLRGAIKTEAAAFAAAFVHKWYTVFWTVEVN